MSDAATHATSGSLRTVALCGAAMLALLGLTATCSGATTADWPAVTDPALEIPAGSALDFSALSPPLPDTRMQVAGEKLLFDGQERAINCATLAPGFSETPGSGFPDHETADRYAVQLARHGYNFARLHFVDALLMRGAQHDLDFNPDELDRFQYFVAALRRNHIHWMIDAQSSGNAGLGSVFPNRWSENRGMLLRVFLEQSAFDHWTQLADKLLTTPNPYTGLSLIDDPHTAGIVMVNEGVLAMQATIHPDPGGRYPALMQAPYARWLQDRRMPPALAASLPKVSDRGPQMETFQRFIAERQQATSAAMERHLRALGFTGFLTQFDNWGQLNMLPSRRGLQVVDMHGYDQVPVPLVAGNVTRSASTLDDGGRYVQQMAGTRFFGRPFIVTEHDQPFWNAYRYESGLVVPAVASLQGWQFVCRHADGPIDLAYDGKGNRKDALAPDGVGLDPVARAAETLTALLLRRKEIRPAAATLTTPISDDRALRNGGVEEFPAEIGIAQWLVRIGIADDRSGPAPARSAAMDVDLTGLGPSPAAGPVGSRIVGYLRAKGLLDRANPSDPGRGSFVSDGGQVALDTRQRSLSVLTPLTAAIAFQSLGSSPGQARDVGPLRITRADAPALVAVSALDGKPLAQSARVLAILAGDARNSGMIVGPMGVLVRAGSLPVQVQPVHVAATLAAGAGAWRMTPLGLNGTPGTTVPLTRSGARLLVPLATDMDRARPTTYFLLQRNNP